MTCITHSRYIGSGRKKGIRPALQEETGFLVSIVAEIRVVKRPRGLLRVDG
jgi:hypothetical protein